MASKSRSSAVRVLANQAGLAILGLGVIAALFVLLSGLGWVVSHVTVFLEGEPDMWAILNSLGIPNQPTLAGIAFGFLVALGTALALFLFSVRLLASIGAWIVGFLR